jgi:Bacterial membrane protein YfhO
MTQQREMETSTDLESPPHEVAASGPSRRRVRPAAPAPALAADERPSRRRLASEAVGIAVITIGLAGLAMPALRDRRQTFYEDVIVNWFGPQAHGLGQLARRGIWLPIWLRTNYGGEPYLANTQHGAVYPGNLPFWFLPTGTAFELVVVGHLILASVAMWAYCRLGLRTSMWAGWLGAVCFTMGASTLAHITLGGQVEVICLMPLIFLTGHMALERRTLRWVVACAVSIGLGFLAGHVEEWLYILVALALYGVAWILFRERGGILRRLGQAVATLGGAVGLFVLLFGWQLFPSLLLSRQTYRNSPTFRQQFPLPEQWALNALLPDYDHLLTGENEAFVGLAATCLVGLAIAVRGRPGLWLRVFVLVSIGVGLLMAVGGQQPVYRFLYDHVSVLRGFRVPSRWLLLCAFGLSVGAALGLDQLLTAYVGRWRARLMHGVAGLAVLVAGAAAALVVVGVMDNGRATLRGWVVAAGVGAVAWLIATVRTVPRAVPALVLLAVTAVELVHGRPGAEWRQKTPNQVYEDYGENLAVLSQQGGRYLSVAGNPARSQLGDIPSPADVPQDASSRFYYVAGMTSRIAARPDTNLAVQAETIVGRDGGFLPLRWYREFYYAAAGGGGDLATGAISAPPSKWSWDTLDFLGVTWFISNDRLPAGERAVLAREGFRLDGTYGYTLRWKRDGTNLARLVHQVDVVPTGADRITRLTSGYPLLLRAMVDRPVRIDPAPATAAADDVQTSTQVDGTVDVRVRTDRQSLLVLADAWYPGWRVSVDGKPAELVQADHAFRGVVVPAGEHQVRFSYVDRPLQAGAGLAGLTLLGLVLAPLLLRRRRRTSDPDQAAAPHGERGSGEDGAVGGGRPGGYSCPGSRRARPAVLR